MTVRCTANRDGLHRVDYESDLPVCVDCGQRPEPCEPGSRQWLLNRDRFNAWREQQLRSQRYVLAGWFDEHANRVFTIGLDQVGAPEILMTGVDADGWMSAAVTELADLVLVGHSLADGDTVDVRHDETGAVVMEVRIIAIDPAEARDSDLFNQRHAVRGDRDAVAVQAVWPGRHKDHAEGTPLRFPHAFDVWRDQPLHGAPWWGEDDAVSRVAE